MPADFGKPVKLGHGHPKRAVTLGRNMHRAVRAWLQQQLDRNNDPGRCLVSQWLRGEALLFLVDKSVSEAYLDDLLDGPGESQPAPLG